MRILHVITSLHTGGAEKLIVDLLPRFKSMGNEVELLLFDGTPTPFYNQLIAADIKIHHFSIGGNVYNPSYILRLRKFLKRYDIIHTHNTACQYFVSLASRIARHHGALITTEHNTTNRRRGKMMFRLIDRFVYKKYNVIIAIADSTAKNLQNFIGNNFPICVIHNGIDTTSFLTSGTPTISSGKDIVVSMVAAFRPQKNQETIIKAIALLPSNYILWLAGDGERRQELESLANSLNVQDRVLFLGVRTDIPAILSQSHIIVLSSHWEGLSLSSVEGCASGRPVVASDVPGLREVIGGAGILFPDNDAEKLAYEIKRLAEDSEHYKTTAERCLARAKQYDINRMAKEYHNLYETL